MLNRRKFIKYSILGTAAFAIGYPGIKLLTPYSKAIATILSQDLKGMLVKEEDITRFAEKAALENPWKLNPARQKFLSFYNTKIFRSLPGPFNKDYLPWRNSIVATFLLSTDFFTNKMDEQAEIKFSGNIWSPYSMSCYNPFSSLYYNLD